MSHLILVLDDEPKMRAVLRVALEDAGFRVAEAEGGEAALKLLEQEPVDLVLSDLRMPGMSGHEFLLAAKRAYPALPVILMTAYSSVRDAVQAIKDGAFDYISKPFEIEEVVATIGNALRLVDALRENERLRGELEGRYSFKNLVGNSPAFRKVIVAIGEVCESRANVLLSGESGTGKEMVARAIHFNSPRRDRPFVALNCAAIPENLLESELFGHVKGAFTGAVGNRTGRFAQADGGTLFLDEIGDMPLLLQSKILRVLQERTFEPVGSTISRTVDVRIIAATNKNLTKAVAQKEFREDLFYRLNVFPIHLPPLRDRREDIPQLAEHFIRQIAPAMGKRILGLTPPAVNEMQAYAWPGNIRELQNCIERAIIVAKDDVIGVQDLPAYLFERSRNAPGALSLPVKLPDLLDETERNYLVEALKRSDWVQVKAADFLGLSERSLWHKVKKHRIIIPRRKTD